MSIPPDYLAALRGDLLRVLWEHPTRLYDPSLTDAAGAYGTNRGLKRSTAFLPEQQRYAGDLWTAAGVLHPANEPAARACLAAAGPLAAFALTMQRTDGSFMGTQDAEHSASLLAEAWSRGLLAMKAAGYATLPGQYKGPLTRLTHWLMAADVRATGIKRNAPYSHRRAVHAALLLQVGALYGIDYQAAAAAYLTDLLARQWTAAAHPGESGAYPEDPDGKAPYTGAYDISYHMVTCARGLQCWLLLPAGALRDQLGASLGRALDWAMQHTAVSGGARYVDPTGSSRIGTATDTARDGMIKSVDLRTVILGFGLGAALDPRFAEVGAQIARGKGWMAAPSG